MVCILGKAVSFDTDAINVKPGLGSMIELLKFDVGDSAVCLGAAETVGVLKPEGTEVYLMMPGAVNITSARALNPGDIVKASNKY